MPNADAILASLTALAADYRFAAQAWHLALLLAAAAWLAGWRPRRSLVLALLALALASAGLIALADAVWFNGLVMSGLAAVYVGLAIVHPGGGRQPRRRHRASLPGLLMLGFAWFYPHFAPQPWFPAGLYSSPIGVLPCPTLAAALGVALLVGGLGSRPADYLLVAASLFYGVFGVLVLGVTSDVVLVAGSIAVVWRGRDWHRAALHGKFVRT
jgi:hypothetical protein